MVTSKGRGQLGRGTAFEAAATAAGLVTSSGKSALHGHSPSVECGAGWRWSRSVDLDAQLRPVEPSAPVWDAGVGLSRGDATEELVVWIEPHPASSTGEVDAMMNKLAWLRGKLATSEFKALRTLTEHTMRYGTAYRWLARTGAIRIRAGTRAHARLVKAGLGMPMRHLTVP